jgi:hypothetical protein
VKAIHDQLTPHPAMGDTHWGMLDDKPKKMTATEQAEAKSKLSPAAENTIVGIQHQWPHYKPPVDAIDIKKSWMEHSIGD